jgi:hypothetical protein
MEIISIREIVIKENIYLSFDISTSCIGISIFDEKFDLIAIKALNFKLKKDEVTEDREILKGDVFKEFVVELTQYNILDIFIEEPLVKSNNVYTVNKLLKFNGICSYILRDYLGIIPKFMSVDNVRRIFCPEIVKIEKGKEVLKFKSLKIDPKMYIFEKVSKMYPIINWVYDKKEKLKTENLDITDSIALAHACFKTYYNVTK